MSKSEKPKSKNIKKPSKKKTFAKYFFITFSIVLAIGVGSLAFVSSMLDKQVFSKQETPSKGTSIGMLIPAEGMFTTDPEFTDSERINILLLGTTKEQLSDTIMLASYDPKSQDFDIISVPRDTYHEREGFTDTATKKINAAYWGDPVNSAQAVHEVLQGIPINYYAVIDYEGVANIVDAIGGVEVEVPFDMNYEKHSEDPPLLIHLKAGKQTLNGEDAVGYLRYRSGYGDGDYGRINTQQDFVKRAIKQSIGLNLPSVAKAAIDNVNSDLSLRTIVSLATKATDMSEDSVETHVLPGNSGYYNSFSFFFSDWDQTESMLRAIYKGEDFEATTSAITGPDDPNFREWDENKNENDSDETDSDETYDK